MTQYEKGRLSYELDPDGDVILILQNPDAPFAALVTSDENQSFRKPDSETRGNKGREKDKKKKKGRISAFPWLDGPRNNIEDETRPDRELVLEADLVPGDVIAAEAEPAPEDEPALEDDQGLDETITGESISENEVYLEGEPPDDVYAAKEDNGLPLTIVPNFPPKKAAEIRFKLSSMHLKLACVYFKKMFQRSWKESSVFIDGYYTVTASEWDAEALLILMNVIHGRSRNVPRSISLEMLAKIAVLVDYYKCYEVVEFHVENWIQELSRSLPNEYNRDLVLWLTVSWVFSHAILFKAITKVATKESKGPLQTFGLPVPSYITDTIISHREDHIEKIVSGLHKLLTRLFERKECKFECSAILSGALAIQLYENNLFTPKPPKPFSKYSIAELTTILRGFKSPVWRVGGGYYETHACSLTTFLEPLVEDSAGDIGGLALKDIQ